MYIVIRVFNFQEKFSDRTKVGQETQTNVSEENSLYVLIVIDDTICSDKSTDCLL